MIHRLFSWSNVVDMSRSKLLGQLPLNDRNAGVAVDGVAELVHELVLHPGDVPLMHLARELDGAGVPAADHPRAREALAVVPPLDAAGDPPQSFSASLYSFSFSLHATLLSLQLIFSALDCFSSLLKELSCSMYFAA